MFDFFVDYQKSYSSALSISHCLLKSSAMFSIQYFSASANSFDSWSEFTESAYATIADTESSACLCCFSQGLILSVLYEIEDVLFDRLVVFFPNLDNKINIVI